MRELARRVKIAWCVLRGRPVMYNLIVPAGTYTSTIPGAKVTFTNNTIGSQP